MSELPQTRHSLLIRLRERSHDAWEDFLSIYQRALVDFARSKGLQEADALDVAQEVLVALERKIPHWDSNPERGKLRGWLFRVARNLSVDKIIERSRAAQALRSADSTGFDVPLEQTNASGEFLLAYRRKLMHWAAKQVRPCVSEKTWRAFWLTAMEGMKPEIVAKQLGLSSGNVYAAKFRVTARIQKLVHSMTDFDESDWPLEEGQA